MLQTLRKHDPSEAARILSAVTFELLPNPEVGRRPQHLAVDPQLHTELWQEIRRRAKVDPSDSSPHMRGKIFEFLFAEIAQVALPKSGVDSVKSRLSLRGELRPDLYEVEFDRSFRVSEEHGVRRNHVLEAIRNADDVQHLNLFDNAELVSLFLRTHDDFPSADPFALCVIGRRVGARLNISEALRIFRSDIDYTAAGNPLDVLRMLANKYGYYMTVGHITERFIFNKIVTIEQNKFEDRNVVKISALKGSSILTVLLGAKLRLHDSHGIALAFALDQKRYADELRSHGLHVKGGNYTHEAISLLDDDNGSDVILVK